MDLLVDLLLVRKLTPWHGNSGKRLTKSPKVFIHDSGLVHCLLNIPSHESLLSHPILGASWEAFVIENLLQVCNPQIHASFYRSSGGAEIDLILEIESSQDKQIWAIEIKRSLKPEVTRGFCSACEDISPHRKLLVYSGDDHFQTKHGIEVIGLNQLLQEMGKLGD